MRRPALNASAASGNAEIMREDALPDQSENARQENARADQKRVPFSGPGH